LREIAARLSPLPPAALASLLLDPSCGRRHASSISSHAPCSRGSRSAAYAPARWRWRWPSAVARPARAGPALAAVASGVARRPAIPALLVPAGAIAYAAWFASGRWRRTGTAHTRSYDLAIFDNLMWEHRARRRVPDLDAGEWRRAPHFARHATLLAYALRPSRYGCMPRPARSAAPGDPARIRGAAAVLLARIHSACSRLRVAASPTCSTRPARSSNLYDFHFLSISPSCSASRTPSRRGAVPGWWSDAARPDLREDVAPPSRLSGRTTCSRAGACGQGSCCWASVGHGSPR
jgi:hypothetical protein